MEIKPFIQFKTVDEYLALQPDQARAHLELLRQTIRKAVPEAEEFISYQMPAYRLHGMIAFFAAFKNHYSFFAPPRVLLAFKDELKSYQTSKSAVRIPFGQPVPVELVTKMVQFGAIENLEKAQTKRKK